MLTELISTGASKDGITSQIDHIRDATKRPDLDGQPSDFGRDGGRLRHHHPPEPVDIAALVNEVTDANQPLAVNKQQTINVSAPLEHRDDVRHRPDPRGDRQSALQRIIQPDWPAGSS